MTPEMNSFCTASTSTNASARSSPILDELLNRFSLSISHNSSPSPSPTQHATTVAISYGRNQRHRTILQRFIDRIRREYYHYQVTFGIYVMTPGEKFVANTFVVVFLALLLWALVLYFL